MSRRRNASRPPAKHCGSVPTPIAPRRTPGASSGANRTSGAETDATLRARASSGGLSVAGTVRGRGASEAAWQAQVVHLATMFGWLVYHTHDSRRSQPGFPDLVLVRDRVLYRELKTATGRVSAEQQVWLDRLERAGADAAVWRPGDIDAVVATLR